MQIRSVTFLSPDPENDLQKNQWKEEDTQSSTLSSPSPFRTTVYFAGLESRLIAFLADLLLMFACCVALRIGTASIQAMGGPSALMDSVQVGGSLFILFFYHLFWEGVLRGKTPGKALWGIRVVDQAGRSPSLLQTFLRQLGRLIDIAALGSGLLMIARSKRQQRFGDWLAGTQVVRLSGMPDAKPKNLLDLLQSWGLLESKTDAFNQELLTEYERHSEITAPQSAFTIFNKVSASGQSRPNSIRNTHASFSNASALRQ
jgi:uncharacterized RDD family membrane protein YckC